MLRTKFERKPVIGKRSRKLRTVPDQSLTVKEMYERFVRSVPIGVKSREGVFVDQDEHDLEAVSRLDLDQRQDFADAQKQRVEDLKADLKASEEAKQRAIEEKATKAAEARLRSEKASKKPKSGSDSDESEEGA